MTTPTATPKQPVTVTDPKIDAAVREKLITARIGLLLRAPFFGNMATRLELTNADEWCPTLATDGRKFYYNSEFVNRLPTKQCEFGFGHEVLHNIYDHFGRLGSRDPQLANIAQDYAVNYDLIDQRIGEKITVIEILYDKKYANMSWEEIYDELMKNAKKINVSSLANGVLDQHMHDGIPGQAEMTEAERKAIQEEVKEAMVAAAQAAGADNLPANIKRMIKELTEPQMDWRDLLQQQIESTIKSDFTWMRPSRRSWHMDAIMPGMANGQQIDVFVGIDTSGSITDQDLKIFLSEVKGIMDAYTEYKINIVTWDTSVHNPMEFTSDNMTEITEYVPGGGGGTDPHCVWEYLKDNDITPKKLIMFTDFEFWGWRPAEVENYCDTVWIIKGNKDAKPTFGVYAHYDEGKRK